jgi:hypothetical protein
MHDLFGARKPAEAGLRTWSYRPMLVPESAIGWRNIVQMRRVKTLTVVEQDVAEFGATNAQSVHEHGLKYGLHVARRRADNLEDFGARGL